MVQDKEQTKKVLPESDLELNYIFTCPQWGDDTVTIDLQNSLTKERIRRIPKGKIYVNDKGSLIESDGMAYQKEVKKLWSTLGYLTRDLRLANYDRKSYEYCSYYYELAGDFINEGFPEAGAICIQRAAIHGEMSQGKGGFLRKLQQTLIKEERSSPLSSEKSTILNKGAQK